MNRVKAILIILLLSAFVCGCSKASSDPQQAATVATAEQQPAGGAAPLVETKYFSGSIGSSLGLQMKLIRQNDQLSGSYFYKRIGTRIDLRGKIDENGNVDLDEFDPSGKQTGNFKGVWQAAKDDGLGTINGSWSKPNSQSNTPFSLQEEPIQFRSGVEVVAKKIKESNKKLKYEIDVEYPELTGSAEPNHAKFNREAKALVQKKINSFKSDMGDDGGDPAPFETMNNDLGIGYTVAFANDDLISIEFDIGTYYSGAAHPNSHSEVINYDLKTGKLLKLADLFKPGTKYLDVIASYSIKDLKRQSKASGPDGLLDDETIESGASAKAENYQSWTITRKGLAITFDAYQVGPYAAGPQHVVIPYTALQNMLDPEGVLTQFVR